MSALVDTNILLRLSEQRHPLQAVCEQALDGYLRRGQRVFLCAQAAIEYWAVATRPTTSNGLGLKPAEAEQRLQVAERWLVCLPEPPDIADRWRRLVNRYSVVGKQAHDARLVAFMQAHGLTDLLTLNPTDFARYEGIRCVLPADVR